MRCPRLPSGDNGNITETVAIASVTTSGIVAISIAVLSVYSERSRTRWQVRTGRLDELREILDGAALALSKALYEMGGPLSLIDFDDDYLGGAEQARSERLKQLKTFEHPLNNAAEFEERLAVRLGPASPLVRTYKEAEEAARAVWEILTSVIFAGDPFNSSMRATVGELGQVARDRQRSLLEQAQALVGPDAL
jgi:hypothetical protein